MSETIKVSPAVVHKFKKFAKKSRRTILSQVLVTPDKMVATDSYKILVVETETDVKKPVLLDGPKFYATYKQRGDVVSVDAIQDGEGVSFPEYEKAIPKSEPKQIISVDANYLMEVAKEFKDSDRNNQVFIEIRENNDPLVFRNEGNFGNKVTAVLMPLKS